MVKETDSKPATKKPSPSQSGGRLKARSAVTTVLQLLAAILFVGAIFWILAESGALPVLSGRGDTSIPQSIAGYKLQKTVTGQAAVDELTAMHGKDVELSGGWIGHYQGGGIVWYGDIVSEAKASELIARMTNRIAAGNPTFTNLRQFQYEGVPVYSVIGTGQQHFYYQAGAKLIWLAAPRGGEEPFLRDFLRVLK